MKKLSRYAVLLVPAFIILFSCKDKDDLDEDFANKGYSIFCWPSESPCDNREFALEFSRPVTRIEMVNGQLEATEQRGALLICCRFIQPLIDTLTLYNDLLEAQYARPLGTLDRRCMIGNHIEVYVTHESDLNTGKSFASLGFRDNRGRSFTFYVPFRGGFAEFREDLVEHYKGCCQDNR